MKWFLTFHRDRDNISFGCVERCTAFPCYSRDVFCNNNRDDGLRNKNGPQSEKNEKLTKIIQRI